jgi:hypothetical protein
MDKFTEFIQTRAVPECKPYYEKGQTPESNSGLFCVVPKAVYEEYMQLKRRNSNQPTVTIDRSTAKIRVEHYPAKVFLEGRWYETIIRYVGDKIGDKYVLMQKDAGVCVVTRKDAETKKRNGFFGLFGNGR